MRGAHLCKGHRGLRSPLLLSDVLILNLKYLEEDQMDYLVSVGKNKKQKTVTCLCENKARTRLGLVYRGFYPELFWLVLQIQMCCEA